VPSRAAIAPAAALALLACLAAGDGSLAAAAALGAGAAGVVGRCLHSCATAVGSLRLAVRHEAEQRGRALALAPPSAGRRMHRTTEEVAL
jgi:outer membrane lipoprotein SlyB